MGIGERAVEAGVGRADNSTPRRPVVVGEVLFDVFPDGARVLGGAPLNVAWHLHAFGLRPLLVSRVGDDDLGAEALRSLKAWGMDCSGLQIDPDAQTGRVVVELDRGSPRFDIVDDQAYDRLDGDEAKSAVEGLLPAMVYHGSLMVRSQTAAKALDRILLATGASVFLDVNLRDPWWRPDRVLELIRTARWVKLNDDELGKLTGYSMPEIQNDFEQTAAEFARRHGIGELVVTCGADGAFVWADDRSVAGRPPVGVEVIDTVGAGDAFSAVWITGLLRGWDPETTLVRALEFAAVICGVRGATTDDPRIYDHCRNAWRLT